MKHLIIAVLVLIASVGCGGDSSSTATDFSGKIFDAAFPENSPILYNLSTTARANLSIQYVFSMDGTGSMRIKAGNQVQPLAYSWQVENNALILKFNNGEDRYKIKKAGSGYELSNSKNQIFLFPTK
jgi:uncharacterized membrane protein